MNEGTGGWRLIAEVMDVCHHVMAQPALVLGRFVQIDIIEMGAHLGQRGSGDREAQVPLDFHQREPQPAPQTDAAALAPERLHGGRGVARGERRDPGQTAAFARAASWFQSARN